MCKQFSIPLTTFLLNPCSLILPRQMVANAFAWAERHGRKRKNEIHGEWEIQIVLEETFKKEKTYTEETQQSGTMEVQVW